MELTIQLAIIMIGNQAINGIVEMVVPFLVKMYKTLKVTTGIEKASKTEDIVISCNQWTEDYKLSEMDPRTLYYEYLEMGELIYKLLNNNIINTSHQRKIFDWLFSIHLFL